MCSNQFQASATETWSGGGKCTTKVDPVDPVDSSETSPPMLKASCRVMAKPKPLPPGLVDTMGSKRCSRTDGAIPVPASVTRTIKLPSEPSAEAIRTSE